MKKILGGIVGFSFFLHNVSSVGNVFTRPDEKGKKKFTLKGLNEYIIAPFDINSEKFKIVWGLNKGVPVKEKIKFMQFNWVLMTSLGIMVPILITNLEKLIF